MHTARHLTATMADVIVIGGGVNGTAIARDAAGRGYSVTLLEQGDLAQATSSASTKLIHGGLRYLEQGHIWLVRKALKEREILLKSAPHIIWPLRFVLPLAAQSRPQWMIRSGLKLYDHLAKRDVLPESEALNLTQHELGQPLSPGYTQGFAYSDCWVDDARLVVLQAVDAARNNARIHTRTQVTEIIPDNGTWRVHTQGGHTYRARMVINAAGPWVQSLANLVETQATAPHVRLVRGSHIVVNALHEGDQAFILQQPDGRIVFAIPYEGRFTLIGTTDIDHGTNPNAPAICTPDEITYLCAAVNRYFKTLITPQDVVWHYSGVRPLFDKGHGKAQAASRDYHVHTHAQAGAPMVSVYGGKITTCRVLAEDVCKSIEKHLGARARSWTARGQLPGGAITEGDFVNFLDDLVGMYPWLEGDILFRYARCYGSLAGYILQGATSRASLGRDFGCGVFEAELQYLKSREWARTSHDILWRRSKLGLHITPETRAAIKDYMGEGA